MRALGLILSLSLAGGSAVASSADPCEAYKGIGDMEIAYVRCRDKFGGWGQEGCDLQKKNTIQHFADISRFTEQRPVNRQRSPSSAAATDRNAVAQARQQTSLQRECAAKAPKKPQRIVVAFDGLSLVGKVRSQVTSSTGQSPAGLSPSGMRSNIISKGINRVPNTRWQYHDESTQRRQEMSDSVRCAYEWATKPYKNSKGETVYSSISIVGYSFGGNAAFQLAEKLRKMGVAVDLMVTLDPRQPHTAFNVFRDRKPASVGRWVNFYEKGLTVLPGFAVDGAENHRLPFFSGLTHVWASHTSPIADGVTEALNGVPVCRTSPGRTAAGSAPVSCF